MRFVQAVKKAKEGKMVCWHINGSDYFLNVVGRDFEEVFITTHDGYGTKVLPVTVSFVQSKNWFIWK